MPSARRTESSATGPLVAVAAPPDRSIWKRAPMAFDTGSAIAITCGGTLGSD
jgi:hypothetical protein